MIINKNAYISDMFKNTNLEGKELEWFRRVK